MQVQKPPLPDKTAYDYPRLVVRYKALFIDFVIWLGGMTITMVLLGDSEYRSVVLITMGFLAILAYEPLLSASFGTIGQRAMKIRVRDFDNPTKNIGVLNAYIRIFVKALLGWMSFLTINFNTEHRAIHDFAGRSVMITLKNAAVIALVLFSTATGYSQKVVEPANSPSDWSKDYPPFRVVGNIHYVGTYDLACYLITTSEGNILINTGLASSASTIKSNIETLGFKLADTKILLTTQAHYDHVGAMAEIKRQTGARLMVHENDPLVLADGGKSDYAFGGEQSTFEPVTADKLLRHGDVITLGKTKITLLHHPGHTKGSSSFLLDIAPEKWSYRVLIVNMPSIVVNKKFTDVTTYPAIASDYAYTFDALKKLEFDIWLSSHASQFGLHAKHKPGDPYDAQVFMDRKGFDDAVKGLQTVYEKKLAEK
jgi:metallo-beta-lactamase class B